jgi:cytosine/adenosine deaminase-related metal-dependent hydrolase
VHAEPTDIDLNVLDLRCHAVKLADTAELALFATRAELSLLECITHGTTTVRTHVEVDEVAGLRGFRAISRLARDYASFVELELCVFAQEGLTQSVSGQRRRPRASPETSPGQP